MYWHNVWINKSNKTYPVIDYPIGTRIGSILPGEIFGSPEPSYDLAPENFVGCIFRNPSGQRVSYPDSGYQPVIALGASIDHYLFTSVGDYPYSTVTINNKQYKTFKARRTTSIIRPSGDYWGAVAAGCLIALADDSGNTFSGETKWDYIALAYVQSTSGAWVKASGDGLDWCFAPIGLNYGSGPSNINFIGSF